MVNHSREDDTERKDRTEHVGIVINFARHV